MHLLFVPDLMFVYEGLLNKNSIDIKFARQYNVSYVMLLILFELFKFCKELC